MGICEKVYDELTNEFRSVSYFEFCHNLDVVLIYFAVFHIVSGELTQLIGPQFVSVPPPRVDFAHNSGATLVCSAYGQPTPTVQWILADDDSPVVEVENLRLVTENGTLTFPPFLPDDYVSAVHEASYRCIARNRVGSIRSPTIRANAGKCYFIL